MDGEDIEVFNYFKNKKIGFYVDVGAYHPIQRNNTMLLYLNGWEGINIDINKIKGTVESDKGKKDLQNIKRTGLNTLIKVGQGYLDKANKAVNK